MGFATSAVGSPFPPRLLLASPTEMLNASFFSHNDNHQEIVQAPGSLLLTDVLKLLSMRYGVEVRDKAQQESVGGANTKK
jgi:hypothetical protein